MRQSRNKFGWIAAGVAVVCGVCWPVETWLECRERLQQTRSEWPDAIYLVAGARDQSRRIQALVGFVSGCPSTNSITAVLVGNDRLVAWWSPDEQRNLTRAEWAVRFLDRDLQAIRQGQAGRLRPEIVPGIFHGTDAEMEALAKYLLKHRDIHRLIVVTSPFHVRRTLSRLEVYLPRDIDVSAVASDHRWTDYAPWTVLGELLKIGRDALWLSRMSWLSRGRP